MKSSTLINLAVLILLAIGGYTATLYFDRQTPTIQTAPKPAAQTTQNAGQIPAFSFTDTNGKTHEIQDFHGKTIILNFWASWCAPCIKEMPDLLKAAREMPNTVFIGLSSDIDEATMLRFIKKITGDEKASHDNIIFALDTENVTQNLFQTFRLPETILIDKDLIMQTKIIGAEWAYEDLITKIKALQTIQQ